MDNEHGNKKLPRETFKLEEWLPTKQKVHAFCHYYPCKTIFRLRHSTPPRSSHLNQNDKKFIAIMKMYSTLPIIHHNKCKYLDAFALSKNKKDLLQKFQFLLDTSKCNL